MTGRIRSTAKTIRLARMLSPLPAARLGFIGLKFTFEGAVEEGQTRLKYEG
jgi:hypothetical protein